MPPLNVSVMQMIAKVTFMANMINLPIEWQQPGKQYPDAFKPGEKSVAPVPLAPPYIFKWVSTNKYHIDTVKAVGQTFSDFIDKACGAIGFAVDMWKIQAHFQNIQVMAVCAIGGPGCLTGPGLGSHIRNSPQLAASTGQEAKYRDAVADAFDQKWKSWQDKVMVPALPWYPAFAAFPGPMAPPMPNVPVPLIACPSAGMADLTPPSLKNAMVGALGESDALHHKELFEAIATGFSVAFLQWLPTQQVMLVMGKGPVPTFAPPFVPVGPVIGGDIIPAPGHLIS